MINRYGFETNIILFPSFHYCKISLRHVTLRYVANTQRFSMLQSSTVIGFYKYFMYKNDVRYNRDKRES